MEHTKRLLLAVFSIGLFMLGLQLLGESTQLIAEALRDIITVFINGDISSLGAGWFLAYLVLNGATSAAIGIALLESGLVSTVNAYMMISGSRLGAAFIVVFIGVLEYVRGKNPDIRDSCSIGILQFLATYIVYIPAIALGYLALRYFELSILEFNAPASLNYGLDMIFQPFVNLFSLYLSPPVLFVASIGVLIVSLQIFDLSFKGMGEEKFRSRYLRFRLSNKWIAFSLGALITFLTTSVALSVGIIVPMYNRGYFRRKEIIPYLMGANLTTMISSVLAAVIIQSPTGMKAVMVLSISVLTITMLALVFYDHLYRLIQEVFNTIMINDRYLAIFIALLLFTPLIMILGF